ncbi:MAG: T9SS type A sorting domain-containing protein [Paludibacter sp.]|nr:T9SS type A sorting domain-containing protein [Paludibacter sp.]
MKKYLILVFVVCSCLVSAQKYVPFPPENAEWNQVLYMSSEYALTSPPRDLKNYSLGSDTILDTIRYTRLILNHNNTIGFLREANKKIYYIGAGYTNTGASYSPGQLQKIKNCSPSFLKSTGQEYLLYDFNVKTGDTIYWGMYGQNIIDKVDSVKIDGSYRKQYHMKWGSDIVIEGIGSAFRGLLNSVSPLPMCGAITWWDQVCFSQNGKTLFMNPAFKDCNSTIKWSDRNYLAKNTEWYYGKTIYFGMAVPPAKTDDYYYLKSTGDTIVGGKNCHVINQFRGGPACYSYQFPVFMYQSNDTLYFYNSVSKKFSILNVYAANRGDSWITAYPQGDVVVTVDSVGSVPAFGETLKLQYVTYTYNQTFKYNSKIIENIGDFYYLFASNIIYLGLCDEMADYPGLRCYIHPDYGTYKTGTVACDYVSEVANLDFKSIKVYLSSTGNLIIDSELQGGSYTFELFDVRGSRLLSVPMSTAKSAIAFGDYSKGLYLYRLLDNGKMLKSGKIVKM